jgi:hypothetical protein
MAEHVADIVRLLDVIFLVRAEADRVIDGEFDQRRVGRNCRLDRGEGDRQGLGAEFGAAVADRGFQLVAPGFEYRELPFVVVGTRPSRAAQRHRRQLRCRRVQLIEEGAIVGGHALPQRLQAAGQGIEHLPFALQQQRHCLGGRPGIVRGLAHVHRDCAIERCRLALDERQSFALRANSQVQGDALGEQAIGSLLIRERAVQIALRRVRRRRVLQGHRRVVVVRPARLDDGEDALIALRRFGKISLGQIRVADTDQHGRGVRMLCTERLLAHAVGAPGPATAGRSRRSPAPATTWSAAWSRHPLRRGNWRPRCARCQPPRPRLRCSSSHEPNLMVIRPSGRPARERLRAVRLCSIAQTRVGLCRMLGCVGSSIASVQCFAGVRRTRP